MFKNWPRTSRRRAKSHGSALRLERLEARDCPAGEMIRSFAVTRLSGRDIEFSGVVTALNPTDYQIRLNGVANSIASINGLGIFHGYATTVGFGQISAWMFDLQGTPVAKPRIYDYQNLAPVLNYQVQQSGPAQFRITGTVADEDPQLSTVLIGGAGNGSATPNTTGEFSFTFNSSSLGVVQAQAIDSMGVSSGVVGVPLVNLPPVITSFVGSSQSGMWVLSGTVADEVPAGLVVTFHSSIPLIDGAMAVVQSNGSFSRTFLVKAGQFGGLVSADTVDWFGERSNTMFTYVG